MRALLAAFAKWREVRLLRRAQIWRIRWIRWK